MTPPAAPLHDPVVEPDPPPRLADTRWKRLCDVLGTRARWREWCEEIVGRANATGRSPAGTPVHALYWGLGEPAWGDRRGCAVLIGAADWQVTRVRGQPPTT